MESNLPNSIAIIVIVALLVAVAVLYLKRLTGLPLPHRFSLVGLRLAYTLALALILLAVTVSLEIESPPRIALFEPSRTRDEERISWSGRVRAIRHGDSPASSGETNDDPDAVVMLGERPCSSLSTAVSMANTFSVPLFVVAVSPGSPEIEVGAAESEPQVRAGMPFLVRATIRGRGLKGKSTLVTLSDGVRSLDSARVEWTLDNESMVVPLRARIDVEGHNRLVIEVEAVEGEKNIANNSLVLSVDARRRPLRVLVFEDRPDWETRFLREALAGSEFIETDYFARVSLNAYSTRRGTTLAADPTAATGDLRALGEYDVVVLGPVEATSISAGQARNLLEFVERRGGGLIFLGANDFAGSVLSRGSPIKALSPATAAARRETDSLLLVPTDEGRGAGLFTTARGAPIESLSLPSSGLAISSLRPGAVGLARDERNGEVAIAGRELGEGRTMLMAPSESWRAALSEEDTSLHRDFWNGLILWAAANAAPPSFITPMPHECQPKARMVLRDREFRPMNNVTLEGVVRMSDEADGRAESWPVHIRPGRDDGVFELDLPAGEAGKGEIAVTIRSQGYSDQSIDLDYEGESMCISVASLRSLAEETGGAFEYVDGDVDIGELLAARGIGGRPERVYYGFAESTALAFLVPLLMACEYYLRRRYGIDGN